MHGHRDIILLRELVKLESPIFDRAPLSPESDNARRPFERHEHDANAAVAGFVQMGGGLNARAGEVHEPELARGRDAEILAAFRGDVDVAGGGEGSRGYPEHFLV